jgi:hypothetical protein
MHVEAAVYICTCVARENFFTNSEIYMRLNNRDCSKVITFSAVFQNLWAHIILFQQAANFSYNR